MLSALGISSSTHDAAGIGTSSPAAKVGAVISQAIAGSRAYQRLSAAPSRSASQRSEEHTSELQSLMRISYAVFCLKKNKTYHPRQRYLTPQVYIQSTQ